MNTKFVTRADVLRRTGGIVALSVGVTLVMSGVMSIVAFGIDPDASVRVGSVTVCWLAMGAILSAALSGGLSYRTGCLLQKLMRAQAELLRLSHTDQLTGLLNRRGFDEAASAMLAEAHQANLAAVALMCDIDHFKTINDRFGHECGDAVLSQISEILQSFAAQNDILVARHGGEEFAALMIGATIDQAALYAETLRQMCAAKDIAHKGTFFHVTVSIGIAAHKCEADLSKIMRCADDALYAAKHRGRNCVVRTEVSTGSLAA